MLIILLLHDNERMLIGPSFPSPPRFPSTILLTCLDLVADTGRVRISHYMGDRHPSFFSHLLSWTFYFEGMGESFLFDLWQGVSWGWDEISYLSESLLSSRSKSTKRIIKDERRRIERKGEKEGGKFEAPYTHCVIVFGRVYSPASGNHGTCALASDNLRNIRTRVTDPYLC